MAGWFASDDPWTQEPDDARRAAIGRVLRAEQEARRASQHHRTLHKALTTFADRCLAIAQHWERDATHYRTHRRFAAVDAVDLEKLCSALARNTATIDPSTTQAIETALERAAAVAADTGTSGAVAQALQSLGVDVAQPAPPPPTGVLGKAWGGLGALTDAGKNVAVQVGRRTVEGASAGIDWAVAGTQETFHRTVTPARALVGGLTHAFSARSLTEAVWNMGGWGVFAAIVFPPALPAVVGLSLLETVLENAAEESGRIEEAGGLAAQQAAERRKQAARTLLESAGIAQDGPQFFATPYVHTIIDAGSGTVTVRILEGRYAGYDVGDLDEAARRSLLRHAPDADTRTVLAKVVG